MRDLNDRDAALLPCPFCGGHAVRISLDHDEFGNDGGDVIQCETCLASSHVEFGFKENLVSAWNRRALPAVEVAAEMRALTAEQGAIISAYTGYMACSFSNFHAYAERKLGRPIWTHQFPSVAEELREAAKADFVGIAAMKDGK